MIKNKNIFFVSIIASFLAVFLFVGLASNSQAQIAEKFTVSVNPRYPGPNDTVDFKASSYTFDVSKAYIGWAVNDEVVSVGIGNNTFSFQLGDIGEPSEVIVYMRIARNNTATKTFYFYPSEIDILWEAQTYIPPAYKGKAMPARGSLVKFTAVPNYGTENNPDPSKLIFEWEAGNVKFTNDSGKGKDSIVLEMDAFSKKLVSVEVKDPSDDTSSRGFLQVGPINPEIIFYYNHLLEGPLYNSAMGREINLSDGEISARAEPYFFSLQDAEELSYEWKMNNKKIEPEDKPNLVNLAVPEGSFGSSVISLFIKNISNISQFAQKDFKINFGFR